ncbi:PLP-dependent aminotransferase family protein [Yoonia sp. BS5-3]|uniref:PLP-dependent aminotransferase family protein n=1 Tax=Yoonia phaeophyticola TaxID=3137369 RepID=A0ABZ2V678_9RHOB
MIVSGTKWEEELRRAGRSKYKALARAIREGIVSGQLQPGHRLPAVRDLAFEVAMTPGTVARAYKLLIDEGRLTAGVGKGTFVSGSQRAPQAVVPGTPILHDPVYDMHARAHLLSPKMPDLGQSEMIREAMRHVAAQTAPDQLLRYPSRDTDLPARLAFAKTLSADQVGSFTVDDIVAAHGGQSGIIMVLQSILRGPSPIIAVDELSYGGFRSAAMLNRATLVGIPWDDQGPRPDAFELAIKEKGIQVFCTSAEVCNPTVLATSPARRLEIVRVAERYGVHILDDDCYRLMQTRYIGPSYRQLLPELGWYVTSPSKSITASLRIGFVIAPHGWSGTLQRTAAFGSFGISRLVTDVYAHVVAQPGFDQVIDGVKARIRQDIRAAVNMLGRYRMNWAEDVPFFWLDLPEGWRAGEFCQAAETAGVLVKSAEDFALRDSRSVHSVRVAVNGLVSHQRFCEALQVLRELLDKPPERIVV